MFSLTDHTAVPSTTLSRVEWPHRSRVGVIGLGHQARTDHLPAVTASDHVELAAICDSDPDTLANVGREYTVPAYRDAAAMFTEQNLDFVVVAVPHHAGAPIIRTAAEHGVHVLKEKPLATSLPEARALAACSAEAGIEVMVTMQRRFNPIYVAFNDLAERVGRLYHLHATYTLSVNPADGWRGHARLAGGGCLLDMGYHVEYDYDAEDTATLTLGYNSGMVGTVLLSRCMAPKTETLRVTGTDGAVQLERGRIQRLDRAGTVVESLTREQSWPTAAVAQVNHFCRVLAGTCANTASPESHLAHAALIHAAYTSAAEGRFIDPRKVLS
ncbi:Gfo/Idh/MocA family oxidoreductase [Saccharopolyspora tripterygii]